MDVQAYFSPAQIDRAEDFRTTQRLLGLGGMALGVATLTLIVVRARRAVSSTAWPSGPLLGGAAAGAGLSLVLAAVSLPLDAVAHERARDVGLSTQTWGPWAEDVVKSAGVSAAFAGVGGALALALVRRFRRRWWIPGSVAVVGIGVVTIWLFPVVIDPLFNKFDKLPRGELRSQVLELARRARRGRGPGLPRGREPPDHRAERVRERARAQQARGALRQPDP